MSEKKTSPETANSGQGQASINPNGVKWLMHFAGGRKGQYIFSVFCALIGVAASIAPYFILADIIRELIGGNWEWSFYLNRGLLIGMLWVLRYLFHSISTMASHLATFDVLADIRKALLAKLSALPLGTVQEQSSGSYKNIICERVESIETTLAHIVPEFTSNICGAVVLFIYMMTVDWRVTLWSLSAVAIGFAAFMIMMASMPKYFPATVEKTKILNDTAVEYINGIEVIKAFGQSKTSYGKFVKAAKEGADCFIDWMRSQNLWQNLGMACFPATLLGLLPAGVVYMLNGSLTQPDFILLVILSFGVMTPLIIVFGFTDDISVVRVIMGEIADILDKEDLKRPEQSAEFPTDNGIMLSNVHFAYNDKEILHGVSLQMKPGTLNALVGPSGSGKSTIAKLIASLWDVGEGSILIGGVDVKNMPLSDCNQYIAYVSQDNYLFNLSVMDNIRMGNGRASDEEVIAAAKKCGCHDFIMSLEHGYQTICGGAGGHLSGGERQRIAIARAMLKNAPIVILDEATSYTDPESEAVLQSALSRLVQEKTVLMIAHRLSTVTDCDCIHVVQDGNIIASGTHEELLSGCLLYQKMWNAHMSAKDRMEVVV